MTLVKDFNRTILVVDDEPETLKGYAQFLGATEAGGAGAAAGAIKSSRSSAPASGSGGGATESYRLLQASSGEKALTVLAEELKAGRQIAAGFFDVKMGAGLDGLSTIQEAKKLDPEIHCVVVTAYQDRDVDEINKLFGEDFRDQWDYLNKPFTRGEIVQKARQMVAAWNRRKQLQQLQQELIRTERMAAIGQVARGIGHEFGNILLRIMGKADLALMDKDVGKIHEHLKVVISASERASSVVRNLASFAREAPASQTFNLQDAVEETLSLVNHELVKASVEVEKSFSGPARVHGDKTGIGQVVLNLAINAMHAMPKGGKLRISIEPAASASGQAGYNLRVADTGVGIPPEVLPKIFDFAFSTKGDKGSGIGLSVSWEIVHSHGGDFRVRSTPGQGTEFTIWLPQAQGGA